MISATEAGGLISALREKARMTQGTVAAAMAKSQSTISRMEAGGDGFELADYLAYLAVIPSGEAKHAAMLLQMTWIHTPRPPLQHPDIDQLAAAELTLARLADFLAGEDAPQAVAGQALLLKSRIEEFAGFLRSLKHSVAWVGDIGVGKTTAACRQAGLVVDPAVTDLRVLLDTGGGRVTLCEVIVETGAAYEIQVEPLPDEEVYRNATDLTRALWMAKDHKPGDPPQAFDFKPPEETERALRNMCGLIKPPRRKGVVTPDPAIDLMNTFESLKDFQAEVAARLTLWRRTRRQIGFEGGGDLAGRQWLKDTFGLINNGRHAEFSLPGRINVSVPFPIFQGSPFEVQMVDTRGVDGSAVRPDIIKRLNDRRTVSVLCSRFNAAPDLALQTLLQHLIETEVDPALADRVVLLALARTGEPLAMRDDSGHAAEDVEEGQDIKRGHVEDALAKIGAAGVEVEFFDSSADPADALTDTLARKIQALRQTQSRAMTATIGAVDEMLQNVARAQALAVLESINKALGVFATQHRSLKGANIHAYDRLVSALRSYHPRTVWAATRRKGSFWNFDVYQHLGAGAAMTAKRRCKAQVEGLKAIVENMLGDPENASARSFLNQIQEGIGQWEADFVEAVRHQAVAIYKPQLRADQDLWTDVESRYGMGDSDYRGGVADKVQTWFEEHEPLGELLEKALQRAWRVSFLRPLRNAAGEGAGD